MSNLIELQRVPTRDHGHSTSKPMVKSLPFFKNARGLFVHRVKSGMFHYSSGAYTHAHIAYWCGNIGFPDSVDGKKRGSFLAEIPEGVEPCAQCQVNFKRKRHKWITDEKP